MVSKPAVRAIDLDVVEGNLQETLCGIGMTTLRNRETDYQLQIHTKLPCEGYSNHLVNVLLKETAWTVEVGEMLQGQTLDCASFSQVWSKIK